MQHLLQSSAELYMPTKKRRLGFIPRSDVLEIIIQLSIENNLSNSKIINLLVEEALSKRGIFNVNEKFLIKNSSILENKGQITSNNRFIKRLNENTKYLDNSLQKNADKNSFDADIYEKFIMFLEFQKKMNEK